MGDRPFKIPGRKNDLIPFVQGIIEDCYSSLERRRDEYRFYSSYYYTGSADGLGTKHNKCFPHIDKLSSLLFSAAELRFDITFDGDASGPFAEIGENAARYLTREYARSGSGLMFGKGLDISLVNGTCFIKKVWGYHGPKSYIIRPQFMGVYRDDINDLDEQDAFVQSFYVTPAQLNRLLAARADRKEIMDKVSNFATKPSGSEYDNDYFHEMVMGGLQPVGLGGPTGQKGTVNPYSTPNASVSPEVAATLVKVNDVWIMDDEREDWTTIRYIDPGIILEGDMIHRNLSDIPKEQPYTKICPNEIPGNFWGLSELAGVVSLQQLISARMNDADTIIKRQARPSRVFMGFNNINPERAAALMSLDGMLSDDSPNGKIDTLAPTMPPDLLQWIGYLNECFDDMAGITNIMGGQGEQGVRSGQHANTLLRTSTPRLMDRALVLESQVADDGDKTLKMLQTKNAQVLETTKNQKFILEQLPEDAMVTVDSHSASPAFSGDLMGIAFNLRKLGAIDNADLIDMIPGLPRAAELKLKATKREEEQAKLIQQHPELLEKGHHK